MTDAQETFLRAIAARVPLELVAEVHLFPSIRQGAIETGLAVIATSPVPRLPDESDTGSGAGDGTGTANDSPAPLPDPRDRHTVFSARYRLTLRGPDRGKLEVDVTAEAEAPLVTVDQVVRGVQRRSADVGDPERFSGDELRQLAAAAIV